jgi:hypothetical protein
MNTGVGVPANEDERTQVEKIRKEFEDFRERRGYRDVNIDTVTTLDAVRHLIDSLKAHKAFHGQDADKYMRAAHWVCWLVKIKPLYLRHGNCPLGEIDEKYAHYKESGYNAINENFAFSLALGQLDIESGQVGEDTRERFIDTLYRCNLDPAHLALTLELLFGYAAEAKRAEEIGAKYALVEQIFKA